MIVDSWIEMSRAEGRDDGKREADNEFRRYDSESDADNRRNGGFSLMIRISKSRQRCS